MHTGRASVQAPLCLSWSASFEKAAGFLYFLWILVRMLCDDHPF